MTKNGSKRKLIVFDVEGVLLPKNRYLTFEVGRNLSFFQFIKFLFIGFLYEARILSLESSLKRIFKLFRNFKVSNLLDMFEMVPMLPHTEEVFAELRKKEFKTVLISSGLPQVVVDRLSAHLKADYAFGLELETNNDVLTGNIGGEVIKKNGKALVLEKILQQESLSKKDCVVVADDRNNAQIFYQEALKIGYNPDSLIAFRSDHSIKENLLEVTAILEETQIVPQYYLSSHKAFREAIHASGFLVTFIAMYLGVYQAAFLLSLTTLVYAASELARIERKTVPIISSITLNAATSSERYEFTTAPIFFALGITLSLLVFQTPINYAAIAILTLADSAASLFGSFFGKTPIPYNKGKSLEGSLAGFVFALLGTSFFLNPIVGLAGAVLGIFVESLPLPINDNLSIPLTAGALMSFLWGLLL